MKKVLALSLLGFATSAAFAQYTAQTIPSEPLSTFQSQIGVNLHTGYTDGQGYDSDGTQILSDLQAMGISHVRDAVFVANYTSSEETPNQRLLASNKIHFSITTSPANTPQQNVSYIDQVFQGMPAGAVDAVEGFNEINNDSNPSISEAQAETAQYAMYQLVHADSNLPGAVVYDFTGGSVHNLATMHGFADYANIHPYPKPVTPAIGDTYMPVPQPTVDQNFKDYYTGSTTGVITEFNYYTITKGHTGVDQKTQAAYIFDNWLDTALYKNVRSYIYELNDNYFGDSYGLKNYGDNSFKTSGQWFTAVHQTIPFDQPSAQKPVTVLQASVANGVFVNGLPAGVKQYATTAANGDIYLWTWNETTKYDETTNKRIDQAPIQFAVAINDGNKYGAQLITPELDFALPADSFNYNGMTAVVSYYEDFPTCTHFIRQ